jgi:hypothetical protein
VERRISLGAPFFYLLQLTFCGASSPPDENLEGNHIGGGNSMAELSDVCAGLCALDSATLCKVALEIRRILVQRSDLSVKLPGKSRCDTSLTWTMGDVAEDWAVNSFHAGQRVSFLMPPHMKTAIGNVNKIQRARLLIDVPGNSEAGILRVSLSPIFVSKVEPFVN